MHQDFIEFILVDFGSTDGLKEWVISNFEEELSSNYLRYFYTEELPFWDASLAKNTAHLYAKNDIVVNLDCDNFTGYLGGKFVITQFYNHRMDIILHQRHRYIHNGSFGRIGVLRKHFQQSGGYDQNFVAINYEDVDFIDRLKCLGLTYVQKLDERYNVAIPNTKEEGFLYTNSSKNYDEIMEHNKKISDVSIAEGCFQVNNGNYGIKNLEAYKTKAGTHKNEKTVLQQFIRKIAVYSGFSSESGLMKGKMGIAILLYHYLRKFYDEELEKYADNLIDEIFEAILENSNSDITGVSWAINYLIVNGFLDGDVDEILKEADEVLWNTSVPDLDIAKTGLYLFSRMETSKDKTLWTKRAEKWIKKVRTLTKQSMDFHSLILVMYCSHVCKTSHKFPVITTKIFRQIFSQIELLYLQTSDIAEKYILYSLSSRIPDLNKLSFLCEPFPLSDWQPTLTDINKIAVYELILGQTILKMPDCCKAKINTIVSDKSCSEKILSSLTPENIGLKYMGGFVENLLKPS